MSVEIKRARSVFNGPIDGPGPVLPTSAGAGAIKAADAFTFEGSFLAVLFVPGEGFVVLQGESRGNSCRPVEFLALFPAMDHPERSRPKARLSDARFRASANAFARTEAKARNLPVWTAAAGKAGA